MTTDEALAQLTALGDPTQSNQMAAYHKVTRPYLGVRVPVIDDLADTWRAAITLDERLTLADGLWQTNIHEARVAAAKLLTQARLRPSDDAAWALIQSWIPDFDAWAIADHVSIAGAKRLVADPERIKTVAAWVDSPHMWTRRAALVMTLPWTKQNFPKDHELAIRDQILGWCTVLVPDRDWFIQKAIAWWLRELSRHDTPRVVLFLADHGDGMKPFARKEAARHLAAA